MTTEAIRKKKDTIKKMRETFWGIAENIALFCFSSMFIIMLLQVFSRYVIKIGMPWTDEAARFLFIWSTFLGAAIAQRTNSHIKVTILTDRLKGKLKQYVEIITDVIDVLVSVIIIIGTVLMMKKTYGILASSIPISYTWIYLSLALGVSIILILILTDILKKFIKAKNSVRI